MLDTPNFFWDSEPTLHPLYHAVREYLEIKPRIQVLNERCRVFLDLAEILSDSIADNKMSRMLFLVFIPKINPLHFRLIILELDNRSNMDNHRPHPPLHLRHLLGSPSPLWHFVETQKRSFATWVGNISDARRERGDVAGWTLNTHTHLQNSVGTEICKA